MNILFISDLSGGKWAGPNYSVPNRIAAQSRVDNVFWYNVNEVNREEWNQLITCHNTVEYPEQKINSLPVPFNKPDLVIFEEFHKIKYLKYALQIWRNKIPYIIVPRSQMTKQYTKNKYIKKAIANFMFFNFFAKKALGIQYLTKQELEDSGNKWNKNSIIIPNGIKMQEKRKAYDKRSKYIQGVYIGRMNIYQKGIDLFVEACSMIKEKLINNNIKFQLYGPESASGSKEPVKELIDKYNLKDIISVHDGVYDKDKEAVLLNADFFVLTSRYEGLPMAMLEALSYGLPCLVTTGTNMDKPIEKYRAGWSAELNVLNIRNAILKIIDDKERLDIFGQHAVELAQKYNWSSIGELSSEKFKQLLKNM